MRTFVNRQYAAFCVFICICKDILKNVEHCAVSLQWLNIMLNLN